MVKTDIRVIYGDTDQAGVVYHGNYLRYFEAGRNEFLRAEGLIYRELEAKYRVHLPVVDAQITYKTPGRFDDVLTVETVIARLGGASVRFEYRVVRGDVLVATGHTLHACVSFDGQVQRLPDIVRAQLAASTGGFRDT
jgi:acyl-CoA thioester hydrolase